MEIRRAENAVKVRKLRSVSDLRECACRVTRDYLPGIFADVSYAEAKLSGRSAGSKAEILAARKYERKLDLR